MRRLPFNQPKSKYRNEKVTYQGMSFDSKKELQRYLVLLEAERRGIISDLKRQVKFELIPAITEEYVEHLKTKDKVKTRTLQLAVTYICDFTYVKDGVVVIEDIKSDPKLLTKEYQLKKKMLYAMHRLSIKEVYKPTEPI